MQYCHSMRVFFLKGPVLQSFMRQVAIIEDQLSQLLELQQKRSLAIILGSQYRNYTHARSLLNLPRLDSLREESCLRWAIKAQKDPKHSHLFPLSQCEVNTRHRKKFTEYFCRTSKYYNSSVPHMTRALNKYYLGKQVSPT